MQKRKWNFKNKGELIYIQTDSTNKVLGIANGSKVIEEEFQEGKSEQLWKIGEAMALHHTLQKGVCDQPYMWPTNAEGYFTLENSNVTKIMTANYLNSSILQIKGNITLK